jgi:hypothetical protein
MWRRVGFGDVFYDRAMLRGVGDTYTEGLGGNGNRFHWIERVINIGYGRRWHFYSGFSDNYLNA